MVDIYAQFPFFPQPAVGETIYSLFCRFIERTGFHDTHLLQEFTGQRRYNPLLLPLPSYLPMIAAKLPEGHPWRDTKLMIRDHTSVGYFTYFEDKNTRERFAAQFAETVLSHPLIMSLGLTRSQCRAWSPHPRYCPTCAEEDRNALGFSFFRREHQLPGVAVCWRHGAVLAHGCNCCGTYPIKGRALGMAGKCFCEQGITPLAANDRLPTDKEPLLWLAQQSAYMVNSAGTGYANTREALRDRALERGLGRGSLLNTGSLAECIENRFGHDFLNWLGAQTFDKGRPAAWVRRLLGNSKNETRSPTILFLLVVGSLFESVEAFEKASEVLVDKTDHRAASQPVSSESVSHRPAWSCTLSKLLRTEKCGLPGISSRLGIPLYQVIEEIRQCGWRVPLSLQTRKKLGGEIVAAIKNDLRKGTEKTTIMRSYGCSEWALTLVELDEPGLNSEYREAAKLRTQEENRTRLLQYLGAHPDAGRSDIMNALPSVYDRMMIYDKAWFQEQISKKKTGLEVVRKERVEWTELDVKKHAEISKMFDDLLVSDAKPVQVTATAALNMVNLLSTYYNNPEKFPLVRKILEERSESRLEFLRRRISWAIEKMAKDKEQISVNKLRRVAGLPARIVRDHKGHITETAQRLNAEINGRSFFS